MSTSTGRSRCLRGGHLTGVNMARTWTPGLWPPAGRWPGRPYAHYAFYVNYAHPLHYYTHTPHYLCKWQNYANYAYYAKGVHNNTFYAIYAVYAVTPARAPACEIQQQSLTFKFRVIGKLATSSLTSLASIQSHSGSASDSTRAGIVTCFKFFVKPPWLQSQHLT